MKYEKQHRFRDELNARFPRRRGNLCQQMCRSGYFNGRMAGESVAEAIAISLEAVRRHVSDFVPIEAKTAKASESYAWETARFGGLCRAQPQPAASVNTAAHNPARPPTAARTSRTPTVRDGRGKQPEGVTSSGA